MGYAVKDLKNIYENLARVWDQTKIPSPPDNLLIPAIQNLIGEIHSEMELQDKREQGLRRRNEILEEKCTQLSTKEIEWTQREQELSEKLNQIIREKETDAEITELSGAVQYLESCLVLQSTTAQIYRSILDKILLVLPASLTPVVNGLAKTKISQASLRLDTSQMKQISNKAEEEAELEIQKDTLEENLEQLLNTIVTTEQKPEFLKSLYSEKETRSDGFEILRSKLKQIKTKLL